MNLYRLSFTLRGAYGTPWLADTLYGHLCWAAIRLGGERLLDDVLVPALEGEPVLVLSDGFPGDLLPMPVIPPEPIPEGDTKTQRKHFKQEKLRRKASWVTAADFSRILQGQRIAPESVSEESTPHQRAVLKNQINRATSTTPVEGGLYEFKEWFQDQVTVYALVADGFQPTLERLLGYVAESGFGKRKTVGYGSIVEAPVLQHFDGFGGPEGANGFVSLSTFVPARRDPTNGFWQLLVKYGKVGEELALSENPFKFPLLMLRAGATFYDEQVRDYYGRVVEDVSPVHDFVVQPAFCLPVPMNLPPRETAR